MSKMCTEKEGQLIIQSRADFKKIGRIFVWVGLLLGFIFLIPPLVLDIYPMFALEIIPGVFILVGIFYALIGQETIVDYKTRKVIYPPSTFSFDDISAINLWTKVETTRTQHGKADIQRWCLGLIVGNRTVDLGDGEELAVWHAAKKLAKILNVSVIDACGAKKVELTPTELDLSLIERFHRGLDNAKAPDEIPHDIKQTSDGLIFTWKTNQLDKIIITSLAIIVAGILFSITESTPIFIYILVPLGLGFLVVFLPFAGRYHGRNQLEIDSRQITHRSIMPQTGSILISKLERIRVNRTWRTSLDLISDEHIIKMIMTEDQALWLRDRIIFHLGTQFSNKKLQVSDARIYLTFSVFEPVLTNLILSDIMPHYFIRSRHLWLS